MNIYKNDEARKNVLTGAEILYEAVKTTLGPKGRNVLIRDKFGKFTITHDGVTVAKSVQLKDAPESIGVELIKEASQKMDEVGDGTTSVTVLTYHLIKECDKLIEQGESPMLIKRELENAIPALLEEIDKRSRKIDAEHNDVLNVATVSVGDEKLGKLVADLMSEVGYDGAISVETTKDVTTTTKIVEGYSFDRGYMSPYFATEAREVVLKNPAVIITSGVITELEEYKNVFDALFENNIKNLLLVADNIEADALNSLILNKVKGNLNVVAVKAPGHGDDKLDNLKDIATVTGGTLIDPSIADWQNNLGMNTLGAAEQINIGYDETIIIGGQGHHVEERVEKLKKRLKKAKIDTKDDIKHRMAKLQGKVGVIKVGGATDTQAEETKYRIDDAVASVKAALQDGIVAGGGVTLRDISVTVLAKTNTLTALGAALCAPYDTLLLNSGYDPAEKFVEGQGINVLTGEKIDTLKAGIIDPVKVTKEVVRNAITTACLAITVGGAIVDTQLTHEEMTQLMGMGR